MTLAIYGAGGLGREVLELAYQIGQWEDIIFVDDYAELNSTIHNIQVCTFNELLGKYGTEDIEFIIAVGEPKTREILYMKVTEAGFKLATLIHPSVHIPQTTKLEAGVVIGSNTVISCDIFIGQNTFIQNSASVGHDTKIGMHSVISAFDSIAGACIIGDRTYIGMSVPVKEKATIGSDTIIGIGSVVIRDIPDNVIALGNPARPMKNKNDCHVF